MTTNTQKGFIQIPILIAIIFGVIVVSGAGYVGVKQYQKNKVEKQQQEATTQNEQATSTAELSEVEKLRQEVNDLKKQTGSQKSSIKQVTQKLPTVTELKSQNPQQFEDLVNENKTQLLEASKILSNKNIIARVKPSVVYIETTSGSGSGIIVSADGYVLTNAHVVTGKNLATIKLTDGRSFNGAVAGRDEVIDLALIKINATNLSPAFLGDSDSVEQGDPVFTFGYPLGIEGDVAFKDGTLSRRQKIGDIIYLEISAQILPGNSGGPLVNQAGEVVGVNTLVLGKAISGVLIGETLKYALPINIAKDLIPELKNGRNIVIPKSSTTIPPPSPTPNPTPTPSPTPQPTPSPTPSPSCIKDTWSCTNWSACSASGSQSRSCSITFDCPYTNTPSPSTTQSCTPPPQPISTTISNITAKEESYGLVISWDSNKSTSYGGWRALIGKKSDLSDAVELKPTYKSVTYSNVEPNTTYYYQVFVKDGCTQCLSYDPVEAKSAIFSITTKKTNPSIISINISYPSSSSIVISIKTDIDAYSELTYKRDTENSLVSCFGTKANDHIACDSTTGATGKKTEHFYTFTSAPEGVIYDYRIEVASEVSKLQSGNFSDFKSGTFSAQTN